MFFVEIIVNRLKKLDILPVTSSFWRLAAHNPRHSELFTWRKAPADREVQDPPERNHRHTARRRRQDVARFATTPFGGAGCGGGEKIGVA